MSSTCRGRKPFCWHLVCQRLSWPVRLHGGPSPKHNWVRFSDFSGPGRPPLLPYSDLPFPSSLLQGKERGKGGNKAGAHRFAIFRHDFSLLLLHKKRRILDYLWHSKPGESWSLTEYRKDFTASVVVQKPQSLSDLLFGWKYGLCLFGDVLQVRTYEGDSKLIEEEISRFVKS